MIPVGGWKRKARRAILGNLRYMPVNAGRADYVSPNADGASAMLKFVPNLIGIKCDAGMKKRYMRHPEEILLEMISPCRGGFRRQLGQPARIMAGRQFADRSKGWPAPGRPAALGQGFTCRCGMCCLRPVPCLAQVIHVRRLSGFEHSRIYHFVTAAMRKFLPFSSAD